MESCPSVPALVGLIDEMEGSLHFSDLEGIKAGIRSMFASTSSSIMLPRVVLLPELKGRFASRSISMQCRCVLYGRLVFSKPYP